MVRDTLGFRLVVVMALLFLMGCAVDEQPETSRIAAATLPSSPSAPPTPTSEPCPNLDPLLRELSQSDDPLSLVGVNNLILTPAGLLVRLTLTHPDADLSAYTLTSQSQQDTLWDAYVPLAQLCPLADEPVVVSVEAIRGDAQP